MVMASQQRTYVVTADTGMTVLVVRPDRTIEGYEAYQSWRHPYQPNGYPVTRKQAADFIRRARLEHIDQFIAPYGLVRFTEAEPCVACIRNLAERVNEIGAKVDGITQGVDGALYG